MAKEPRPSPPPSPEPEDPLDLLRALARRRDPDSHDAASPQEGNQKLDALRSIAQNLDRQLRASTRPAAASPAPSWPDMQADMQADMRSDAQSTAAPRAAPPYEPPPRRVGWAEFVAGLPPARALRPRLGGARSGYVAIAIAVLLVAAAAPFIKSKLALNPSGDQGLLPVPSTPLVPNAPAGSTPFDEPPPDVGAVKKAMSECDAAAARDTDSLYFLVVPLLPTQTGERDWHPVALQTIGSSYLLLGANDALDALAKGNASVRPGRYTFSVLDTQSGMTYSWTSATGLSQLARKDSGVVKTLKLGFDFSASQAGPQWSADFKRSPGSCYWIMALLHN